MSIISQPSAMGTMLRRKDGSRVPIHFPERVWSCITGGWVQWITVISCKATIAAAPRVRSFISTFTTFFSTWLSPTPLSFISTFILTPSLRWSGSSVCNWQESSLRIFVDGGDQGCCGGAPLQLQHSPSQLWASRVHARLRGGVVLVHRATSVQTSNGSVKSVACGCHNGDTSDCFYLWHKSREY